MSSRRSFLKTFGAIAAFPVAAAKALGARPKEKPIPDYSQEYEFDFTGWQGKPNELAMFNGEEWIFFEMDPQLKAWAEATAWRIDQEIYKAFKKARGL